MSPPRASKEERRDQIMKAATACFSRKGYHLTTMDDIVAESGLSKGSLYWHYKNKKDLFLSIVDWYLEQVKSGFEAAILAAPTAADRLRLFAELSAQMFSSPELEPLASVLIDFYAATRHDAEVNEAMRNVLNPFIELVTGLIEAGIAAGEFKAVNARQTAIALMAAYDGMYMYRMMLEDEFDWAETGRQFMETLLEGLSSE
ncbi:MAG TPA: TetR/AcrR family transcriptional regulator [Chloroflexi bacterium]|nr:TetR/AcrR family transcriptional regulator [Chloroflexota bacterium]